VETSVLLQEILMAHRTGEKLLRDLERLRREVTTLQGRLDHVHTLASESLRGANRVTDITNQVLKMLDTRLRALERAGGAKGRRPKKRR
jgi:hypothetical protein